MKTLGRFLFAIAIALSAPAARAAESAKPAGTEADDETLMTDAFTIDAGEAILIKTYDKETNSYQIVLVDNPTKEAIFATPESVAKAVHTTNLDSMKADPEDIVGADYHLDEDMTMLFDFEREARKPASEGDQPSSLPKAHVASSPSL